MGKVTTRVHRQKTSVKPWNSENSFRPNDYRYTPVHSPDEQIEIDLCINCPLPAQRCHGNGGCYEAAKIAQLKMEGQRKKRGVFNEEKYERAMVMGMTDDQVAAMFGVAKKTAAKWRRNRNKRISEQ